MAGTLGLNLNKMRVSKGLTWCFCPGVSQPNVSQVTGVPKASGPADLCLRGGGSVPNSPLPFSHPLPPQFPGRLNPRSTEPLCGELERPKPVAGSRRSAGTLRTPSPSNILSPLRISQNFFSEIIGFSGAFLCGGSRPDTSVLPCVRSIAPALQQHAFASHRHSTSSMQSFGSADGVGGAALALSLTMP